MIMQGEVRSNDRISEAVKDRVIQVIRYGNISWDLSDLEHPELLKHLTIYAGLIDPKAIAIKDLRVNHKQGQLRFTVMCKDHEEEMRFAIENWPIDVTQEDAKLGEWTIYNIKHTDGKTVKVQQPFTPKQAGGYVVKVEPVPDIPQLPEQHTTKFTFYETAYKKVEPHLDR